MAMTLLDLPSDLLVVVIRALHIVEEEATLLRLCWTCSELRRTVLQTFPFLSFRISLRASRPDVTGVERASGGVAWDLNRQGDHEVVVDIDGSGLDLSSPAWDILNYAHWSSDELRGRLLSRPRGDLVTALHLASLFDNTSLLLESAGEGNPTRDGTGSGSGEDFRWSLLKDPWFPRMFSCLLPLLSKWRQGRPGEVLGPASISFDVLARMLPRNLRRLACLAGLVNDEEFNEERRELTELVATRRSLQGAQPPQNIRFPRGRLEKLIQELSERLESDEFPGLRSIKVHDSKARPFLVERLDGSQFTLHEHPWRECEPATSTLFGLAADIWRDAGLPIYPLISKGLTCCHGEALLVEQVVVEELGGGVPVSMSSLLNSRDRRTTSIFKDGFFFDILDERCGDQFDPELFCGSAAGAMLLVYIFGVGNRYNENEHLILPRGQFFTSGHDVLFGLEPGRGRTPPQRRREAAQLPSVQYIRDVLERYGLFDSLIARLADGIYALQPHLRELSVAAQCMLPRQYSKDPSTINGHLIETLHMFLTRSQLRQFWRDMIQESSSYAVKTPKGAIWTVSPF